MAIAKHALAELQIPRYSDARQAQSRTNQISGLKLTELQPNGHFRICGSTPKRLDKALSSIIFHEKHDVEVRDTAIAADQSSYRVLKLFGPNRMSRMIAMMIVGFPQVHQRTCSTELTSFAFAAGGTGSLANSLSSLTVYGSSVIFRRKRCGGGRSASL